MMKTTKFLALSVIALTLLSCGEQSSNENATESVEMEETSENLEFEIQEIVSAEESMKEFEDFKAEIIPIPDETEKIDEKSVTDDPSEKIKDDLEAVRKACSEKQDKPQVMKDLTGGYDLFFSSFEEEVAASLNLIPFGSLSGSNRSLVVVYNFLQYKKDYCSTDGKDYPVLWGSGVQMTLHIKSRKRSMKTTTMAGLAAAVDYNRAQVEYRLKTIGIIGDPVRFRVATQGEFSVDNYAKIISNVDQIIRLMSDSDVTVTPQLVAVEKEI
ncbi:MAG TPA: hypothetical protein VFM82_10265 [Flavobacteriaceae bacterium]|nr:hypothetical protein [Flavobacteriaceae bacterium]